MVLLNDETTIENFQDIFKDIWNNRIPFILGFLFGADCIGEDVLTGILYRRVLMTPLIFEQVTVISA